jgi:hypothetical protein
VLEAEAVGVAGVHVVELACEESGLVAARAGPDLDNDVLVVVRVAVDEFGPDVLGENFDPLPASLASAAKNSRSSAFSAWGINSRASRSASIAVSRSLDNSAPRRIRACSLAIPA